MSELILAIKPQKNEATESPKKKGKSDLRDFNEIIFEPDTESQVIRRCLHLYKSNVGIERQVEGRKMIMSAF